MAGFYSARSETIPPLPWPIFAPPFPVRSGGTKLGPFDETPRFAEWLPFGDSVFAVPSMLRAGLARHAELSVDAVMSSAAPVAACLAADALARRIGVPVHHMHGDPWGPCELRQPIRPFWTRALEGGASAG